MSYHLNVEEHPGYLHVTVTGTRNKRNAARFLRDVHAACIQRGVRSALIEIRFTGPSLDTGAIYEVVAERSADARELRKIAYVVPTEPDPAKPRFAETVAVNRGVPVRLFASVGDAREWLLH